VGGFSAAALRRTLRFGDAWQSSFLDGVGTDPSEFALQAAELKRASDGLIRTTIKRYVRTVDDVDAPVEEIPDWQRGKRIAPI
jgi:hypothetical protein